MRCGESLFLTSFSVISLDIPLTLRRPVPDGVLSSLALYHCHHSETASLFCPAYLNAESTKMYSERSDAYMTISAATTHGPRFLTIVAHFVRVLVPTRRDFAPGTIQLFFHRRPRATKIHCLSRELARERGEEDRAQPRHLSGQHSEHTYKRPSPCVLAITSPEGEDMFLRFNSCCGG